MRFRGWRGAGLALVLLLPAVAQAQTPVELPDPATQTRALRGLCLTVGEQTGDTFAGHADDPVRFHNMFERKMITAAGAKHDTDPEVVRRKIQALWATRHPSLRCTNIQFDVSRGSILKYAVASANDDVIDQLIKWGVDLNQTDFDRDHDHVSYGTVLDYVEFHIGVNEGTAMAARLQSYYRKLREAGGLHHREM